MSQPSSEQPFTDIELLELASCLVTTPFSHEGIGTAGTETHTDMVAADLMRRALATITRLEGILASFVKQDAANAKDHREEITRLTAQVEKATAEAVEAAEAAVLVEAVQHFQAAETPQALEMEYAELERVVATLVPHATAFLASRDADKARIAELEKLREVAEDIYANSAGPANDGQEHRCHDCGVDLSMRGFMHEASEHDTSCKYGRLCAAIATTYQPAAQGAVKTA